MLEVCKLIVKIKHNHTMTRCSICITLLLNCYQELYGDLHLERKLFICRYFVQINLFFSLLLKGNTIFVFDAQKSLQQLIFYNVHNILCTISTKIERLKLQRIFLLPRNFCIAVIALPFIFIQKL